MENAIRDIPKKRGRPKTTGRGLGVMVRLHHDAMAAIDAWIAKQPKPVTRPEAVRQLVEAGLHPIMRQDKPTDKPGRGQVASQQTGPHRLTPEDKLRRDYDRIKAKASELENALKEAKAAAKGTDAAELLKLKARVETLAKDNRALKAAMREMVPRQFLKDKERLLADLSSADFRKIVKSLHPDTAGLVTADERNEASSIFLRLQRLFRAPT